MRIRLGELLVKARVISESQLQTALAEQEKWGGKLGQILVRMSWLSEELLTKALSKQLGIPRVDLEHSSPSLAAMRKVKVSFAEDYGVLPLELRDEGATLVVAMYEAQNLRAVDELKATTGCRRIEIYLAGESELRRAVGRHYSAQDLDQSDGDEFKIVDAQGKTVMKKLEELGPEPTPPAPRAPPPPAPVREPPPAAESQRDGDPGEVLLRLERTQRKEVQALKAVVDLLIEKGVFSRDDYLTKVSRR